MSPDHAEKMLFRFVREVPRLPSAAELGLATAGVKPWPHQLRVIRRVIERFPQSFLFSDEVGLGKTIEAALALRSLWLAGRVRRALVLVPRALLRQWQEELHEKAALTAARFEGGAFFDISGNTPAAANEDPNPWNRHDLILASTQMARGPARRREILAAEKWDLVIVDEAHHARRRQPSGPYRPNRLLELLDGSGADSEGLRHRTRALYLLSATPMQIHPVEVWDLLRLLGLGGRWGADEKAFLDYFEQLRRPFKERDWDLLLDLAGESQAPPPAAGRQLLEARRLGIQSARKLQKLQTPEAQREIDAWLRRATPIGEFVWRHTRPLLRRYHQQGLLDAQVPERRPRNVWVELRPRQRKLHRRIEAYLSEFYQRYEARRTGLGFVMTVYRRRLTSSFAAVRSSLERRRQYLLGQSPDFQLPEGEWELSIDGLQQELALEEPAAEGALPTPSMFSRDELEHLDAILDDLRDLEQEPKLKRLKADLRRFLRRRDRVLIFTQYLDTLDQLREALRCHYQVACYSGRGGETWQEGGWQKAEKEDLKAAFAAGEIQVLLCTEAASEGLNLQTCGVLINYDMPWNPMRVEQRIGRIDRIGQVFPRIWIRNYFYADTVEASIYQRLSDRIDWFKAVLGDLQPILHGVGEAVERLALTPEGRRRRHLEEAVAQLRQKLAELPQDPLPPSSEPVDVLEVPEPPIKTPVRPAALEELFLESTALGERFEATGEAGVHRLRMSSAESSGQLVTFDPKIFAERPYSLRLLSWGEPLFNALLDAVEDPETCEDPSGLGLYVSRNPAPVSVFAAPGPDGEIAAIAELDSLHELLERSPGRWSGAQEAEAASLFSRRRQQVLLGLQDVEAGRRQAEKNTLRAEAGELLLRAACLELSAARSPGLFDQPISYRWGAEAISAQGSRGGPFPQLLEIAESGLSADADSPQAEQLRGRSPDRLARWAIEVEQRSWQVAERWASLSAADEIARRAVTDRSAGLLERTYFPFMTVAEAASIYVDTPDLEPFRNAVPLLGDIAEAATTLAEGLSEGLDPLRAAAESAERYRWIAPGSRVSCGLDLFAASVPGRALEPRIPAGSLVLLRLDPSPPRDGQIVLVEGIEDPESGASSVLREWRLERRRSRSPRLRLEALAADIAPIVIEEPGEAGLRVIAKLVDIVS